MSVNEIEKWNNAYGLSKTLLRNFVVGGYLLLLTIIGVQENAIIRLSRGIKQSQEDRVSDLKVYNNRLQNEKDINDSLNRVFFQNFYKVKEATK